MSRRDHLQPHGNGPRQPCLIDSIEAVVRRFAAPSANAEIAPNLGEVGAGRFTPHQPRAIVPHRRVRANYETTFTNPLPRSAPRECGLTAVPPHPDERATTPDLILEDAWAQHPDVLREIRGVVEPIKSSRPISKTNVSMSLDHRSPSSAIHFATHGQSSPLDLAMPRIVSSIASIPANRPWKRSRNVRTVSIVVPIDGFSGSLDIVNTAERVKSGYESSCYRSLHRRA